MKNPSQPVQGPVALKNVASFMVLTRRMLDRGPLLPGLGVCHGPSGMGKTHASIFGQNKTNAVRVEVGDSWTRKTLLRNILREFGEEPLQKHSVADLAEMAIFALSEDVRRPLFIDEADRLIDKGMIEIVRELQECSNAPVILIGEENLPRKLLQHERVHNRVLHWLPIQPCDLEDTQALAKAILPDNITIDDGLLEIFRTTSGGRARRIVTNLTYAKELAINRNLKVVDITAWGETQLCTGEPPNPRHFEAYGRKKTKAA